MRTCPRCRDEFEAAVETCPTCQIDLVSSGDVPPQVDGLLGTFHPLVAPRIAAMLQNRRIAHDLVTVDDLVEVIVDRDHRDDLRAELIVSWTEIVGRMPADDMYAVIAAGGRQPGWMDAPTSSWVDRAGRIKVEGGDQEDLEEASRLWGPTLVALGSVTGLFGWYGQGSTSLLVLGGGVVVLGLLLPR